MDMNKIIDGYINKLDDRALEEEILSKEFQDYKDSLKFEWKPLATEKRITSEDIYVDIYDYFR